MPIFPRMSASRKRTWEQGMPEATIAAPTTRAMASGAAAPVLAVRDLEAWYGESHILHGIDFEMNTGKVVTLLGRNGAGKTTTLKSVKRKKDKRKRTNRNNGQEIIRASSDR